MGPRRLASFLPLVSLVLANSLFSQTTRRVQPAEPPPVMAIGVVPFRSGLGQGDSSTDYGIGIADSITNSLKNLPSVSVLDLEVMGAAMKQNPDLDPIARDADAVKLGAELGLIAIVVGSYQQLGAQIRVDARVLNVTTGRPMTNEPISMNAAFPDGYFDLLSKLSVAITKALQVTPTPAEIRQIDRIVKSTISLSARQAYDKGVAALSRNTAESLREALRLFSEAIKRDPNFGLAYAGKSEAESRLLQMKEASSDISATQAVSDAEESVKKTQGVGRAYRALANAREVTGEYAEAERAARDAIKAAPNDASSWLALARARGRGALSEDDDALERAFHLQPAISFIIAQCPRVTVVNNTAGELAVTFTPNAATARQYPIVKLQTATSRHIALLPGSFLVSAHCEDADLNENREFDPGSDYELKYEGTACAERKIPAFVIRNNGDATVHVMITGHTNRLLNNCDVGGHHTRRVVVVPGSYTVTATAAGIHPSVSHFEIGPTSEEQLDFAVRTTYRIR